MRLTDENLDKATELILDLANLIGADPNDILYRLEPDLVCEDAGDEIALRLRTRKY